MLQESSDPAETRKIVITCVSHKVKFLINSHRSSIHLFILAVHLILLDHLSTGQAAVIDNGIHVGPGGEFPLPVCDGGKWSDNKERALDTSSIYLREQRDGLNGLTQTHLICQDTVLPKKKQKNKSSN